MAKYKNKEGKYDFIKAFLESSDKVKIKTKEN